MKRAQKNFLLIEDGETQKRVKSNNTGIPSFQKLDEQAKILLAELHNQQQDQAVGADE